MNPLDNLVRAHQQDLLRAARTRRLERSAEGRHHRARRPWRLARVA